MSDTTTTDDSAPENSGPKELREAFERMKAQVAERDELIESLTKAARANEFDKAGIPTDKWGAKFRDTYQGDLTLEAIKAEQESWGIPLDAGQPAEAPSTMEGIVDAGIAAELTTIAQAQELRSVPNQASTSDPMEAALQALEAAGDYSNKDIEAVLAQFGRLADN
jgi:peptidoglycan hydrolase-like protein with peptidoglycan-binding domain